MADVPFFDAETQESPALLPGFDTSAWNTLGDIVKNRTTYYKEVTDEIVNGKKATVPMRGQGGKWYHEQISTMSKHGYIPQAPNVYVRTPDIHRVIGYNPTSHYLVQNKRDIKEALNPEIRDYIRIAGTGFANKSTILLREAKENSLLTIAPSGDLNTMKEMIDIIDAKIRENRRNLAYPHDQRRYHERDYPLVIENLKDGDANHYWDGLLRGIKILDYDDNIRENGHDRRNYVKLKDLAAIYGIYITESREQTLKLANTLGKESWTKSDEATRNRMEKVQKQVLPIVPDNSIIYVATATRKKFDQLEEIYKKRGVNVRIRPIYELTDTYVGPEEDTKTYEGNVAKKVDAAIEAWDTMDINTRGARLKKIAKDRGIKESEIEKHIFFLGEDSGFEFDKPGVLQNHRFDDIEGIDPLARHPGVETGPTIFAKHGVEEFFRKAGEVVSENERGITMRSTLVLTPLKGDEYGKRAKYMVTAETKGHFITKPRPADGAIEIDNFLVPEGEKETEAELIKHGSEYTIKKYNKARAWEALALETGIKLDGKGIQDDYSKDFVAGIVIGENHASRTTASKLTLKARDDGFGVITINPKINKAQDLQNNILAKSDAVVLAFDPERAQQDFWQNLFTFMSMVVGEQTHDKYKLSKPLKLINPKNSGKGAFDYLEDMIEDFHKVGTIPQDPATLYQSVSSVEQAIEQLEQERTKYRRMEIPSYATKKEAHPPTGAISRKDFNVAIFCSSASKNTKYIKDANDLAEGLIKADFGLVSGAGLYSSMGEVTRLADEYR